MSSLVDLILEFLPRDIIDDTELTELLANKTPASRHNLIKRALARGDLLQLRRGLYCLGRRYQRKGIEPYAIAGRIYGPSYISLESALSHHGWIPEAVHTIASATSKRSRVFETPQGIFDFRKIPVRAFEIGVLRVEASSIPFLVATPLKAICDLVYCSRIQGVGIELLQQGLRIERSHLKLLKSAEVKSLLESYTHPRVSRFLLGLKKDLRL